MKIYAGYYGENQCFIYRNIAQDEDDFRNAYEEEPGEFDRIEEVYRLSTEQSKKLRRKIEDYIRKFLNDKDLVELSEHLKMNITRID